MLFLYFSAFAQEVGVKLGLGLAERGVRGPPVEALLAVAAGRTLHDVNGLETEVAGIGIGWIVGQPDALEEVQVAEGLATPAALQAAGILSGICHATFPHISNFGCRISDVPMTPGTVQIRKPQSKIRNRSYAAGTGWRASIRSSRVVWPRAAFRSPSMPARVDRQGARSNGRSFGWAR